MARRRRTSAGARRFRRALWSCAGFFALGFFPTSMIPWGRVELTGGPSTAPSTAPASAPASQAGPQPASTTAPASGPTSAAAGPTVLTRRSPVVSMVLAALVVIPFGSTARSRPRGAGRGLVLGAIAGVGIFAAMVYKRPVPRDAVSTLAVLYVGATACLCGGIAALFAHLAGKRRRLIEQQWQ